MFDVYDYFVLQEEFIPSSPKEIHIESKQEIWIRVSARPHQSSDLEKLFFLIIQGCITHTRRVKFMYLLHRDI